MPDKKKEQRDPFKGGYGAIPSERVTESEATAEQKVAGPKKEEPKAP